MSVGDETTEPDGEWQFSEWSGAPGGGLLSQILDAVREAQVETRALRSELAATNERIEQAVMQLTAQIGSLGSDDDSDEIGRLSNDLAELRKILIGS